MGLMCEKCWGDAYLRTHFDPTKSQGEHYRDLLRERDDNPCTPREQLGRQFDDDDTFGIRRKETQ